MIISDLMLLFDSLPDETFKFETIPGRDEIPIVIYKKEYIPRLYDYFDEITIALNNLGQRTITFTRRVVYSSDVPTIIKLINQIYSKFGKDSKGDSSLININIENLKKPVFENFYTMVIPDWRKDDKIYLSIWAETNGKFSITFFSIESDKKDELLEKYYNPFVAKEINGLLISRKKILDNTSAKIISDEFSKSKIVGIAQLAGVENENYISTFSVDDKSITDRTEIGISFAYSGGYFFIMLQCKDNLFKLDIGDTIIFLFENEKTLEISFEQSSAKISQTDYTNNHVLTNDGITFFISQSLKKWKLIQGNKAYKIGDFTLSYLSKHYESELEGKYLIKKTLLEVLNTAMLVDGNSFDSGIIKSIIEGKTTSKQEISIVASNEQSLESVLEELSNLIGLDKVKQEVHTLTNFIKIQKAREQSGLKSSNLSYHVVFTGNPGTGKTTVARILANIYKCLGVLKKGQLIETDRAGLIGEYLGQTAPKVNKIVDSALDGVLFIDEAYSIVASKTDDYGKEAVATLIKRVEDDRERLAVIMAGYNDEMRDFINTNPRFSSRFNRYINFVDYTVEEMVEIFLGMCKQDEYVLGDEAKFKLTKVIEAACIDRNKNFGNGRFVRNLFEKSLKNQSNRLAMLSNIDKEILVTITADDISS